MEAMLERALLQFHLGVVTKVKAVKQLAPYVKEAHQGMNLSFSNKVELEGRPHLLHPQYDADLNVYS
jgi:hypothetical protein